jgi:hypothetical protein
MDHMQDDVKSQ